MDRARRPHVALIVETSLISGRRILQGIASYARQHGPWSIYHEPRSLEASVPRWLNDWQGDGIIARLQDKRIAAAVESTGLPAVDVLGVVVETRLPLVHVNDAAIGAAAADHLVRQGFRNFGYCGVRRLNWSRTRQAAFVRAVTAAGFRCRTCWLPGHSRSDSSWEAQQDRLAAWITELAKPVGVMACYDPVGQKVLEACRRAGAAVPDQVAVIGVDNDETVCEVCDPPLSSVAANHVRVGYEAAARLDRWMHRRRAGSRRPLLVDPIGVVVRSSTDTLAVGDPDLARALQVIRERACQDLHIGDIVAEVSSSRSTLKERFRRVLGHTMHDEIVHERTNRAKQLLAETDLTVQTIARMTGFRHAEYMGVVFKRIVGKTPGEFRKQTRS